MGSYYDIDAILTDAQKVPCTFELEVPGLGYIDDSAGGDVSSALQRDCSLYNPTPQISGAPCLKASLMTTPNRLNAAHTSPFRCGSANSSPCNASARPQS